MIVKRESYYSPTGKTRMLHIHLPDNYDQTEEQYPVMYFFDGHNLFRDSDATYGTCWGLEEYLNRWRKPMMIVGMECGHEGNERLDEYCPYDMEVFNFGKTHGIGEQTMRWLIDEVKPMIDQEYRTCPFREAVGIGGSSMGGLMALYGVVRYNRWFSKAACLSSTVTPCYQELQSLIRDSEVSPDTKVYLSWGSKEARGQWVETMARRNRELAAALADKAVQTRLFRQEGGRHCEADWSKQVPDFMEYLWF